MSLQDIAQVTITTQTAKAQAAGFGVPLILSANAAWAERTRTYTDLTGVGADFATTTPEYKAAAALFSQNPRPPKVVIGRLANKPTQRWSIGVASVLNLTTYKVRVGANTASFTSDGTATNDEIVAGLVAAINALAGDTVTASAVGSAGAQTVQLLGDAPANWNDVEVLDLNLLSIAQTHADPGVAADLAAILLENTTWYAIVNAYNSLAMVTAIAVWAEANGKLFLASTQDSAVITTAKSGTDDVGEALQAAAYARTALMYHPATGSFIGAAWAGRLLPLDPGSETWAYKALAGVAQYTLTPTQRANALAKNVNIYETVAGLPMTNTGIVSAGEYIDVIRFRDWLVARIQERVASLLANANKVPFTDAGIAQVEAEVRAQLREGVGVGGLSENPMPKVTVPKAKDVSSADKAARTLRNVQFDAVLAGAIHSLVISGTVSV